MTSNKDMYGETVMFSVGDTVYPKPPKKKKSKTAKSGRNELQVSDDFCGDCGNKFLEGANKIIGGKSLLCGEYYPQNSHPICGECAEKRYEKKIAEYESKNSR